MFVRKSPIYYPLTSETKHATMDESIDVKTQTLQLPSPGSGNDQLKSHLTIKIISKIFRSPLEGSETAHPCPPSQ